MSWIWSIRTASDTIWMFTDVLEVIHSQNRMLGWRMAVYQGCDVALMVILLNMLLNCMFAEWKVGSKTYDTMTMEFTKLYATVNLLAKAGQTSLGMRAHNRRMLKRYCP